MAVHIVLTFLVLIGYSACVPHGVRSSSEDDTDHFMKLVDLQSRHVDWLLDHPDVRAVDVNYKTVGGNRTNQLSLVIWVKEKVSEEDLPEERLLPRDIEGFQTDIIEEETPVATQVYSYAVHTFQYV